MKVAALFVLEMSNRRERKEHKVKTSKLEAPSSSGAVFALIAFFAVNDLQAPASTLNSRNHRASDSW